MGFKKKINKIKICTKNSIKSFLIKKKILTKVPSGTKSSLFMYHTAYLNPPEYLFQISSQSVKPFNLEIDEHRDIESQNYYINW